MKLLYLVLLLSPLTACSSLNSEQQYELDLYGNYCFFTDPTPEQQAYYNQMCERAKMLEAIK